MKAGPWPNTLKPCFNHPTRPAGIISRAHFFFAGLTTSSVKNGCPHAKHCRTRSIIFSFVRWYVFKTRLFSSPHSGQIIAIVSPKIKSIDIRLNQKFPAVVLHNQSTGPPQTSGTPCTSNARFHERPDPDNRNNGYNPGSCTGPSVPIPVRLSGDFWRQIFSNML